MKETKKAKRINKNVGKSMTRKKHNNTLFKKKPMRHKIKFHQLGPFEVSKIFLSCFYDKRLDKGN